MRLLKFRVWDTKQKCYLQYYDVNVWHEDALLNHIFDNGRMVFQQYTGLKDKNGDEIYEGDIVKATSDQYENENFVGKVIFDEGCFLTWINKNDIRGIWGEDDIEVVGNIFENPELLK